MKNVNLYLTPHFRLSEFACKNGVQVPEAILHNVRMLAATLEALRLYFGAPITINSGYRTIAYNKSVGGASKSYHITGQAADIVVKGVRPIDVYETIYSLMHKGLVPKGAVILYDTFVHYDQRGHILKIDSRKRR